MVDAKEYYLCYIDILGFENRAKEIVGTYDLNVKPYYIKPSHIRNKLRHHLKNKLKELEERNYIIGVSTGRDDWVIVSEELQKLVISIYEITEIQQDFPFEIALGSAIYTENRDLFNSDSFVDEDSTICFLKNNIIGEYCKWYKSTHDDQSVRTTFILFTDKLYQKMDYCDQEIISPKRNKNKILYYADVESFKRRAKSLNFLNTLGIPNDPIYGGIDKLYVIPKEYDEIKKSLEKNKVIIITGNPECGKTFTAVRLLWEYYLKKYQPIWEIGENPLDKKKKRFEKIESDLKEKVIFYFEDPFGEKNYERMGFLEKKIKTIIDKAREFENVFLIITSRSEVFQEFNSYNYLIDIKRFEYKLNAKNNLQEYSEREEILLNWAKKNKCKWLSNAKLKTSILELLKLPNNLPTPLSIRNFCFASCDITDSLILKEQITEKSKETDISFADEINAFSADKILFISFPFISGSFRVKFVEEKYNEMIQEFGIKDALSFASLFKWFRGDKIEEFKIRNDQTCRIKFSHPSYLQALKYLLATKEQSTAIFPEIFFKFLQKLAEDKNASRYIPRIIADNYTQFPKEIQSLLFTLAQNENTKKFVARTLVYNYSNIPNEAQALLQDLYFDENLKKDIARAITDYFYVAPKEIQKWLFEMAQDDKIAGHLARAVIDNYHEVSGDVKNLIFELYGKGRFDEDIARAITENYSDLPDYLKCLLFNIIEKENSRPYVAKAIADKSKNIPVDIVEYILIKLSNDKACEKYVARCIIKNFDNTSDNLKNVLYKYIEKSQDVVYILQSFEINFENLSEDARVIILSKLSNGEKTAKYPVRIPTKF
ncbi:hypothetical protein MSBR3_0137 [Methanosarcina barkeri 3]|uniref:Novel STAND NTPase 3 domain-containing protein n=1 Tax=Methanosarcina barkeri 3 TaxID=1434107 RepID=A0A0E3WVV3_METBA|nr:hypothetical protein [Methanosarcina barkeri]AKB80715.1 hypothetical protein MSBR3_0137 [Methanosarcina barkeri 3]